MQSILFCLYPEMSGYNATIKMAKHLQKKGYRIYYVGFPLFRKHVEAQGFQFLEFELDNDFSKLQELLKQKKFREILYLYKQASLQVEEYIKKHSIQLMLTDSLINIIGLAGLKSGINVMTLFPNFASFVNFISPPVTTDIVPDLSLASKIRVICAWTKVWLKRVIPALFVSRIIVPIILKNYSRSVKLKFKTSEFFLPQINFPHIVLGAAKLDFPNSFSRKYLDLTVDINRKEDRISWKFDKNKKLILCSLGTHSGSYKRSAGFFRKMIRLSFLHPEWQVVLHIGDCQFSLEPEAVPDNCYVSTRIPQITLLKKADVMITHGGMQSVNECIATGVPMIVFPCERDQPGNAARVAYHGLGIKGDIVRTTPGEIIKMIQEILANPEYSQRIKDLRKRIEENSGFNGVIETIEKLIRMKHAAFCKNL
ncbi:MAG: hypothetical protein MRK02_08225 [Candidatus Scalindua sp.]|nr:hypothetical protein [Candidatus Scalindua sp.]